jgi:hypothetical protein
MCQAARIIGISNRTLRREAEEDWREEYQSNGSWRFTWRQIALIDLRRSTFAELHTALGTARERSFSPFSRRKCSRALFLPISCAQSGRLHQETGPTVDDWLPKS